MIFLRPVPLSFSSTLKVYINAILDKEVFTKDGEIQ